MTQSADLISYNAQENCLYCLGEWTLVTVPQIKNFLKEQSLPSSGHITINGKDIAKMDSAGAALLIHFKKQLEEKGLTVEWQHFDKKFQQLIFLIEKNIKKEKKRAPIKRLSWLARTGKLTLNAVKGFIVYLNFIGRLTYEATRLIGHPMHWRWNSLANIIYRSGYQALPIIALLSFMIGIVIAYQMGLQLRNYGANIYIVDLLGLSILREFAPLLTAIMVAGRTGSSFTAQLGIMKINQEIDALNTLGVTPAELLLLPRILGLVIALPLLTMWANIFGVLGGMVMANNMLQITWIDFLHRFPTVIPLRALLIGIGKTPVFALIISSVGCFQGMQVSGSATSVGENTTRSVVLAIFFIIVTDAIFSIIFSKLKL